MQAILVGNYDEELDRISYSQLYPFFENRDKIRHKLDLEFIHLQADTFSEIRAALHPFKSSRHFDIIFVRPTWRHTSSEALNFFSELREWFPRKKIVLIDPWDQVTGRYLGCAEYVDHIFKYQGLKDSDDYLKHYAGGTVITDYLTRKHGLDIGDWDVGSRPPAEYVDRILPGWNFATTPRFSRPLLGRPVLRHFWKRKRDIDVFCRVSLSDGKEWYGQYRKKAVGKLMALDSDYRLAVSAEVSGAQKTSSRQYFNEIKRSRIAFCPFGWGEVTGRDYEAIAYGCLMVKPRIDHVATNPDVFFAEETYVPIEWDFSDLEEKCRYYLEHWDEAEEIIDNARRKYIDYFEKDIFIEIISAVLK